MIKSICPHIPSTQPEITKAFLIELFGMTEIISSDQYIELLSNGSTVGILACETQPNEQSLAVEVSDIEALWKEKRVYLEQFHTRALFTQSYGAKEFHVVAPETNTLIFVSQRMD